MNVGYQDLNCEDVGKALKIDKATVSAWCRKGLINYVDVSEPGSKRPRYMIPRNEFERIQKLIRKYGRRNWLLYNYKDTEFNIAYNKSIENNLVELNELKDKVIEELDTVTPIVEEEKKDSSNDNKRVQLNVVVSNEDKQIVLEQCKALKISQSEYMHRLLTGQIKRENSNMEETIKVEEPKTVKKFDTEAIMATVSYIKDIDDRLADLENERALLLKEREDMKKEILSYL